MYMYIYTYFIYIYTYIHIHIYNMYMYICININEICIYVHVYIYIYIYTYTYSIYYTFMCTYTYILIYISIYVYIYIAARPSARDFSVSYSGRPLHALRLVAVYRRTPSKKTPRNTLQSKLESLKCALKNAGIQGAFWEIFPPSRAVLRQGIRVTGGDACECGLILTCDFPY